MTRQASLGALAAALLMGAPAIAQEVPTQPRFQDQQPMDAGSGASQAGQTRAGVTESGVPADLAHNALQYPMLHVERMVRDPGGARIGWITRVIARDGPTEAYAVVRTDNRRVKVPASKLRASGTSYVLDDVAFLSRAEPAS
jgi:hypothetical protein